MKSKLHTKVQAPKSLFEKKYHMTQKDQFPVS